MWDITCWQSHSVSLRRFFAILLVIGYGTVPGPPLRADTVSTHGMNLPQEQTVLETPWHLYSAGRLKMGFVIPIYGAALYLQKESDAGRVLQDTPKMLEIHYFQDIDRHHMIDAAEKSMQKTLAPNEWQAVSGRVARLHRAYLETVPRGSIYTLLYRPDAGTDILLNGNPVLNLPGHDFARAYFSVWLGPHAASRGVRKQLQKPLRNKGASP